MRWVNFKKVKLKILGAGLALVCIEPARPKSMPKYLLRGTCGIRDSEGKITPF
jgi:hypothetical protein